MNMQYKDIEPKTNDAGGDSIETTKHSEHLPSPKEVQTRVITEWATKRGYKYGEDFGFFNIQEASDKGEDLAPQELGNMYMGFREELTDSFRDYFETRYQSDMETTRTKYLTNGAPPNFMFSWEPQVKLNYSWAGRFLVVGARGLAIDTAPLLKVEKTDVADEQNKPQVTGEVRTRHGEFKQFFKDNTGFDFPTPNELDRTLEKMTKPEYIRWYTETINQLQPIVDKVKRGEYDGLANVDEEVYQAEAYINSLKYILIILQGAKRNPGLEELPERTTYMRDKVRHFNDLTYNLDDFPDLDRVARLAGVEALPDEGRIDKMYDLILESRREADTSVPEHFDRKKLEEICRDFSEKIYPREIEKKKIWTLARKESMSYFKNRQDVLTKLLESKKQNGNVNDLFDAARNNNYFADLDGETAKKEIIELLDLQGVDGDTREEIANRVLLVMKKLKPLDNKYIGDTENLFVHLMSEELSPTKRIHAEEIKFAQNTSWYHITTEGMEALRLIKERARSTPIN